MPITNNDGMPTINESGNPGKSVVIRPDPASVVTAGSLALVPAPEGSPVGQATLLSVSGDDIESEVISLTLDNPNPFDRTTPNIIGAVPAQRALARPFAIVQWGVGGIQSQAEVDFDHGLSFSIPCSYLRVIGVNPPIPVVGNLQGTGSQGLGRNIKLGAFCGFGSVAGTRNLSAKRTVYIDSAADFIGPSGDIKIPDFATNILIVRRNVTSAFGLSIRDEGGNEVGQIAIPAGASMDIPVELTGDAAFVRIGVPADVFAVRLIFGLAF